jgi:hypothetical protein
MLRPVAGEMRCALVVTRGSPSLTLLNDSAAAITQRWQEKGQHTRIIYVGDHDPAGLDMSRNLHARLVELHMPPEACTVVRVAVTEKQISGFDDLIGFRPLGECTGYKVDDVGLHVDVWVPREPDPKRFSGAVLRRFKDVYARIAAGKTAGLSVGGTYTTVGQGIKRWNMSELSIVDWPCLPSASFVLRREAR